MLIGTLRVIVTKNFKKVFTSLLWKIENAIKILILFFFNFLCFSRYIDIRVIGLGHQMYFFWRIKKGVGVTIVTHPPKCNHRDTPPAREC